MIQNIRDLLVVAMAPDLIRWTRDRTEAGTMPSAQEIVGFILDHITPLSYEKLAQLYAKPSPSTAASLPETGMEP